MQYAYGFLALAVAVTALPQGAPQGLAPSAPAPAGCLPDYSGTFQITVKNVTTSATKVKRQSQPLELTLAGGVLKDSQQRTGAIVANYQFQFDGPPQVSYGNQISALSTRSLTNKTLFRLARFTQQASRCAVMARWR